MDESFVPSNPKTCLFAQYADIQLFKNKNTFFRPTFWVQFNVGVVFYKRTGDNFVQIRSSNIAGRYRNCSLTYDGLYLTLTKIASNHRGLEVEIYKRLDDVFTKISGISASSGESITGGSLSYDGSCLAILRFNPEYPPVAVLDIYNRSNDTFSRTLTSPEFESSNTFLKGDCVISPDGAYVLVAGVLDSRIYKYYDNELTLVASPVERINAGSFTYDGAYLAVVANTHNLYKLQKTGTKVVPSITRTQNSAAKGVALENGATGETKPILILEKYT